MDGAAEFFQQSQEPACVGACVEQLQAFCNAHALAGRKVALVTSGGTVRAGIKFLK